MGALFSLNHVWGSQKIKKEEKYDSVAPIPDDDDNGDDSDDGNDDDNDDDCDDGKRASTW